MDGRDVALVLFVAAPVAAGLAARRTIARARAEGAPGRGRLVLGNLLVFAFLVSLGALAGECWLRFVFDSTDQYGALQTTQRWMDRHFRLNNELFRDDVDYVLGPVPAGKRRVTFVGDSFTAGHGVADVSLRFANRVRAARPSWEVHVFATNGAETGRELEILRKVTPEYAFDVIALVYCPNDIQDLVPGLGDLGRRAGAVEPKPFLARNSYLFDTLRLVSLIASDDEVRGYFPSVSSAYAEPPWLAQRERLRAVEKTVKDRGGKLVVVTFPFVHSLGPSYPFRDAHRRLGEFWKDEGIPHLDLLPVFEAQPARDLVVGMLDGHPNEKAHAIAAEAMLEFLDETLPR